MPASEEAMDISYDPLSFTCYDYDIDYPTETRYTDIVLTDGLITSMTETTRDSNTGQEWSRQMKPQYDSERHLTAFVIPSGYDDKEDQVECFNWSDGLLLSIDDAEGTSLGYEKDVPNVNHVWPALSCPLPLMAVLGYLGDGPRLLYTTFHSDNETVYLSYQFSANGYITRQRACLDGDVMIFNYNYR